MRAPRGFTLIELVVVLVIAGILAGLVVWQGRSARQAADLAGGVYDLAVRIGELKGRALADGRDYVLVVADASNPVACKYDRSACGRAVVLVNPVPGFSVAGFDVDPPYAGGDYVEDFYLPRSVVFEPTASATSAWRAPAPFAAVTAADPGIRATCSGGRDCFALRFGMDGEVQPVWPGAPEARAGFALVLSPVVAVAAKNAADATDAKSGSETSRAIFVSFPAGIVKTGVVKPI